MKIFIFLLILPILFFIFRGNKQKIIRKSTGFHSKERLELEQMFNEQILLLLESKMKASGYFKPEKIILIINLIMKATNPYSRLQTSAAFGKEPFLTKDEKKSLGLNARKKYSKEYIDCFNPECLPEIEPENTLAHMHIQAFHKVSNQRTINKLKDIGVKKVRLQPVECCTTMKKIKKVYPINDVPELPLTNCNSNICHCWYEGIIK